MARKLAPKDVVIVGLGWTGSIMANELTDDGLEVVAIERGPWRDTATDFPPITRRMSFVTASVTSCSCVPPRRPSPSATRWARPRCPSAPGAPSCRPTGSAAAAFTGTPRRGVSCRADFVLRTHLTQRYGERFLPPDMTIQDWGVTYEEIEPHTIGSNICAAPAAPRAICTARSRKAAILSRARARVRTPIPPQQQPFSHTLFAKAAQELGYKPFPQPSGNMSRAYTNPLGVRLGPCTYCGFCEWFGCGNYSKASPQTTILPVLVRKPNFLARDKCEVTRINTDATGKRATGVPSSTRTGTNGSSRRSS